MIRFLGFPKLTNLQINNKPLYRSHIFNNPKHYYQMKKFLVICASSFVCAISMFMFSAKRSDYSLLSSNVEAVSQWEDAKLSDNVWIVGEKGDGAIICTPGGNEACK